MLCQFNLGVQTLPFYSFLVPLGFHSSALRVLFLPYSPLPFSCENQLLNFNSHCASSGVQSSSFPSVLSTLNLRQFTQSHGFKCLLYVIEIKFMYLFLVSPLNFRHMYLIAYFISMCGNVTLEIIVV